METLTVFKFEDGRLVKEEWTIGDNKESENEKHTISDTGIRDRTYYKLTEKSLEHLRSMNNFEKFKSKCMEDKEFKKEYDRLQPEYDKIKEGIQKDIYKETQDIRESPSVQAMQIFVDSFKEREKDKNEMRSRALKIYLNLYRLYEEGLISDEVMQKLLGTREFIKLNKNSYSELCSKYDTLFK